MENIVKTGNEEKKNFPIEKDGKTYWVSRSIAVLGLVICESGGKNYILVNKRGEGCPDYNGMWNIPCGYLDYNETLREGVCREIWEECGVMVQPTYFALHSVNDDPNDSNLQNVTMRYVAKVPASFMTAMLNDRNSEKNEVADIMWMDVNDIGNYEWAFNHKQLLKDILFGFGISVRY